MLSLIYDPAFVFILKHIYVFYITAPSSLQIEPVGRWFEANLRRRQQGFFSHHSSSSSNSSAASEGSFSSDEEDEDYLVTLDPSEWKVCVIDFNLGKAACYLSLN